MTLPTLPLLTVDTTLVPSLGKTIVVPAGGDVQAALNAANLGDTITLTAGAWYSGPFTLPAKSGSGWVTVQSSALASLPAPGNRVGPPQAPLMPKVVAMSAPAISTAGGAHHYRLIGIEVLPASGVYIENLVVLDSGAQSLIVDRCYLHGDPQVGAHRGIALNSAWTAVIDSYIADIKSMFQDAEAIMGWDGPGPFKIVNNYLEATGETIMFGGWDPSIPNLVPSDIEIRGNYFRKPLAWRPGDSTFAGTYWSIKNLLELKNAQRVLIDGNVFENCWHDDSAPGGGQYGYAFEFTPANQNGTAPWSIVADVTFTHNIIQHSAAGMNMLGASWGGPSQQLQRVLVKDNLWLDIGAFASNGGRPGTLFQLHGGGSPGGGKDVTIDHNTAFHTSNPLYAQSGVLGASPWPGFVFTNNIVVNDGGVTGDATVNNPLATLATYFPGAVFTGNILLNGTAANYPPGNFFPSMSTPLYSGIHLVSGSPYANAGTDGKDLGLDWAATAVATAYALSGIPPAPPPPPPPPPGTIWAVNFTAAGGTITVAKNGVVVYTGVA